MEFFTLTVPIVTYDVLENIETYNEFILKLTRGTFGEASNDERRLEEVKT